MPKLTDVCRIRSKNAGPFWITIDLFFKDQRSFEAYADAPCLSRERIAALYGVEAASVKTFAVPSLQVVKISYPRPTPQGGAIERDMHGGQHFARLLAVEL